MQVPCVPTRPEPVVAYASLVARGEAARVWQGSSQGVDALHGFAAAAGRGVQVPTGIGVSLLPLRHAFDAAHQLRSLALTTGQPVLAGLGTGSAELQRNLLGAPYASPLAASREYLTTVRDLLAGRRVDVRGEYVTCSGQMPLVHGAPPVDLGLGVLRPRMARLAGEIADAAVLWMAPPSFVRDVLVPEVRAGADAARRPTPRIVLVAPAVPHVARDDVLEALLVAHRPHLELPHYRAALAASGIEPHLREVATVAGAVVDAGGVLHGTDDELRSQADAYRAAGVDELVVNATAVAAVAGPRAAMAASRSVLAAVAASPSTVRTPTGAAPPPG